MQTELAFWGPRSLRGAIADYMARRTEDLADGTLDDYEERARWLLRELGELTPIDRIGLAGLEDLARRHRGVLANVTIARRFKFLRQVLQYAHDRDLLERVPPLPRLKSDGVARQTFHTVEQWRVYRTYLPPGPFRRFYDLGFWTGGHRSDLFRFQRGYLRPGEFWRVNTKNRRCVPVWFPAEPELEALREEFGGGARLDSPICGRLWNLRRTLHAASHRAAAEGVDIPPVAPIDLRRSFATMLTARGYPTEYVRLALGHEGEYTAGAGRLAARPSTLHRHYLRPSPELLRRSG